MGFIYDGYDIENAKKVLNRWKNEKNIDAFENYIETFAGHNITKSKLMSIINKNKGDANKQIEDEINNKEIESKLKNKNCTSVFDFQSDYNVIYCHEDNCLYLLSYKYNDSFEKFSIDQLLSASNKGFLITFAFSVIVIFLITSFNAFKYFDFNV